MDTLKPAKKQNYRKSGAAAAKKTRKREEAAARQAAYDKLPLTEKLARQRKFGGREYQRLLLKAGT